MEASTQKRRPFTRGATKLTGPKPDSFVGNSIKFIRDPLGFLGSVHQEFGVSAMLFLPGPTPTFFHPDQIKHVLQDNASNYTKGHSFRRGKPFLGEGLVVSDGELWRRQRRLLQPAFHPQRLAGLATSIVRSVEEMFQRWAAPVASGEQIDVNREMMRLTLTMTGRTLFSADIIEAFPAIGKAIVEALDISMARMRAPIFMPWLPTPQNNRFDGAMKVLETAVKTMAKERREGGPLNDLLTMLLEARDETGAPMSDKQLQDEVLTIVLGGYETTTATLSWALYMLHQHPEIRERARAEVMSVLGDRPPTVADLPKLSYLSMVLDEVMRHYPPAWMTMRRTIEDDEIGGVLVPKNTTVLIPYYFAQRMPEFWERPDEFYPEHFEPAAAAKRHKGAYLPFGLGPRKCIGINLALMEMKIFLAMALQRYAFELAPGYSGKIEASMALRPADGLPMRISTRPAAAA